MRLLMFGDLAATGFGTVTADLGRAMIAQGDDLRFVSLNESGAPLEEPFASRTAALGSEGGWIMVPHSEEEADANRERLRALFGTWPDGWSPEACMVTGDVASLEFSPIPEVVPDGFPAFHYVPIEGVGLPPGWARAWDRLRPIAMSEFGAGEIERLGVPRPPVVHHGVDLDAFHPPTRARPLVLRGRSTLHILRSRTECKRALGLDPDRIAIFRADANVFRKRYDSWFRALAPVLRANPECDLVVHSRMVDAGGNLDHEASRYPDLHGRILNTGVYGHAPRSLLAVWYAAADLYVSCSSEGFGLTIAEAMACGTPAVGLDFSSVPEVIGRAGVLVPCAGLYANQYNHFWGQVREDLLAEAVGRLVRSRGARRELGALGPLHVAANFRWDRAARLMSEAIGSALTAEAAA